MSANAFGTLVIRVWAYVAVEGTTSCENANLLYAGASIDSIIGLLYCYYCRERPRAARLLFFRKFLLLSIIGLVKRKLIRFKK